MRVSSGMKLWGVEVVVRRCLEQWDGLTSHGVAVAGAGAEARFPKQQS